MPVTLNGSMIKIWRIKELEKLISLHGVFSWIIPQFIAGQKMFREM